MVLDMGLMDKAKELLNQHDDKVDQGIDKLGEMAGKKFGHENEIGMGAEQLKRMTGEGDTTAAPPPAPAEGQAPPPPAPEGEAPPPPPQ
jgi:hypothetical protein